MSCVTRTAVIIGAGPAGLTAALELARRSDVHPIVLEASHEIGGLSRTVCYKGNRMDIGGHRFFSKSDRVMNWWLELLPLESTENGEHILRFQNNQRVLVSDRGTLNQQTGSGPSVESSPLAAPPDAVMLLRPRKSRIYWLRRFFDYPLRAGWNTIGKLGLVRTCRLGLSYLAAKAAPRKPEKSLEDFFINRFGRQLYLTFFKGYTEKVWGVPCSALSADWGAQRIKELSLVTALIHPLKMLVARVDQEGLRQKQTHTSMIEKFLYPKFGPGQLWERAACQIRAKGGEIVLGCRVTKLCVEADRVVAVEAVSDTGELRRFAADLVFSTMSVPDLVRSLDAPVPEGVREVSEGLQFRDFITIGLLVDRMKVGNAKGIGLDDNWIYIQEPEVRLGRLQIFNNWSPSMVADSSKVWLGLEYFCSRGDAIWEMPDENLRTLAVQELEQIGLIDPLDVRDAHVLRVPLAYPAYSGTYPRFEVIRSFMNGFENLFLIGRNGMHRYNNQDHSMLAAMTAVDNVLSGNKSKDNIWSVNTELDYHETHQEKEFRFLPPANSGGLATPEV